MLELETLFILISECYVMSLNFFLNVGKAFKIFESIFKILRLKQRNVKHS